MTFIWKALDILVLWVEAGGGTVSIYWSLYF